MSTRSRDPKTSRAAALAADIHWLAGTLKRRLREQGNAGDLTPSQVNVIMRLDREGPATVTALANAEGVRPQSMGATVAVLQGLGHVQGAPDPADGRQTILSLTESCKAMIRDGRAARQDWLFRAVQTKLSAQEQDELARAVSLFKRLVDS